MSASNSLLTAVVDELDVVVEVVVEIFFFSLEVAERCAPAFAIVLGAFFLLAGTTSNMKSSSHCKRKKKEQKCCTTNCSVTEKIRFNRQIGKFYLVFFLFFRTFVHFLQSHDRK